MTQREAESRRPAKRQYRERYVRYLRTPYWKAKRQAAIAYYGGTCSKCGSRNKIEVHHLRYNNLGHEPMKDLVLVCSECHTRLHGYKIVRKVRYIKGEPLVAEYDKRFGKVRRVKISAKEKRAIARKQKRLQRLEARESKIKLRWNGSYRPPDYQ